MIGTPTGDVSKQDQHLEKRLGLNDRLALIGLIDEGTRRSAASSPLVANLFDDLLEVVDSTVSGAKVDLLQQDGPTGGFKVFEINSDEGVNLGRLNMLYLKKPIPCYYLVYVEVAAAFRHKGLGNMVLKAFREFLVKKSAVGILDNIIPREDPTFDIYRKLDWKPADAVIGGPPISAEGLYMIFLPPALAEKDLQIPVRRLIHHLKRKRTAIDMRDNELMVRRTIEEFKELYSALLTYFANEMESGEPNALMRFMFTRFVTKLLKFRRRIGQLLGYTGGESLLQIALSPEIRSLPVKSHLPEEMADKPSLVFGDRELWVRLPEALKKQPARVIESLPNCRRPRLLAWLAKQGKSAGDALTIGDFLDLGFDPTRLKEITLEGQDYIFERVQARLIDQVEKQRTFLDGIKSELDGIRMRNARCRMNPPLLVIQDRGNGYVLRRKVQAIHWEEAVEQLQSNPGLATLNESLSADRMVISTVREAARWLGSCLRNEADPHPDQVNYFVAWDLENNRPKISVDPAGACVETIWIS